MKNVERVAMLDDKDFEAFKDYATRESTEEEKEELKNDLDFYKSQCPKQDQ